MLAYRVESAADLALSMGRLAATGLVQPQSAWSRSLTAGQAMLRSLMGSAAIQPEKGDKRFRDPLWTSNPGYRALMQSYLAWSSGVAAWVGGLDAPARDKLRARVATDLVIDALAPTNALLTNPAAMKATLEQGGRNLVAAPAALPPRHDRQRRPAVDGRQVAVRGRRATSRSRPAPVVYAPRYLELIQYTPQTAEVRDAPLLFIVPPQINKFYIWDLAPGRSIVECAGRAGPPGLRRSAGATRPRRRADWDLDDLRRGCSTARPRSPARSPAAPDLNSSAPARAASPRRCSAHSGRARAQPRRLSLTLFVAIARHRRRAGHLDGPLRQLRDAASSPRMSRARKGVLDGQGRSASVFAWLRPERPIWNYWVNNYLLGKEPPAFDILYWNADTTACRPRCTPTCCGCIEQPVRHRRRGPTHRRPAARPAATSPATPTSIGGDDRPHHALGGLLPDHALLGGAARPSC